MRLAQYIKKGIVETLKANRTYYYNKARAVGVHITAVPNMRWQDGEQLYRGTVENFITGSRKDFEIWLKI